MNRDEAISQAWREWHVGNSSRVETLEKLFDAGVAHGLELAVKALEQLMVDTHDRTRFGPEYKAGVIDSRLAVKAIGDGA